MTKSVIVTDAGFGPDDWAAGFAPAAARRPGEGLALGPGEDPARIADLAAVPAIAVDFPGFADGRGFSVARSLRLAGFRGRLRARGHVLADQYAMARRSGFDEVEIPADLARRQPQAQWRFRADWRAHDYQARLRGQDPFP